MGLNEILFGGAGGQPETGVPTIPQGVLPQAAPQPVAVPQPIAQQGAMPQAQMQPQLQAEVPPEALPAPQPGQPGFLDKIRSDPALLQSMLMMGARLMQGPRAGQDDVGSIGDALIVGSVTHNMLKENERTNAIQAEEQLRKNKLADQQIAQSAATTAAQKLETEHKGKLFGSVQEKIAQEVKNLRSSGRKAEADALLAEAKANNYSEEWALQKKGIQAGINRDNAAAGASTALTNERKFSLDQERVLADPKSTSEAVEAAARTLQKGRTDRSSQNAMVDSQKKLVREANPDWTDQQVADEVLNRQATAKTDTMRSVMKVLEMPGDYDKGTVANARALLDDHLANATRRSSGAKPTATKVETPKKTFTQADWATARAGAKNGQYKGPDGITYTVRD